MELPSSIIGITETIWFSLHIRSFSTRGGLIKQWIIECSRLGPPPTHLYISHDLFDIENCQLPAARCPFPALLILMVNLAMN